MGEFTLYNWLTSLSSLGKSAPSGIPVFSWATFFRSLASFFWVSNVLFILRYSPWKDDKHEQIHEFDAVHQHKKVFPQTVVSVHEKLQLSINVLYTDYYYQKFIFKFMNQL